MSTQNTDLDRGQEASRGGPGAIYDENTIQQERVSPPVNVPQPPKDLLTVGENYGLPLLRW